MPQTSPTERNGQRGHIGQPDQPSFAGALSLIVQSRRKDGRRRIVTESACQHCRLRKSKCDGGRPACSRCASKALSCLYDVEAGESRAASLKQKHTALVDKHQEMADLFTIIQNAPMEEVDLIVRNIRTSTQRRKYPASLCGEYPAPKRRRGLNIDPRVVSPVKEVGSNTSSTIATQDTPFDTVNLERQSSETSMSDLDQRPERETLFDSAMPSQGAFSVAVDAYNKSVGTLFYVYIPDQLVQLVAGAFESSHMKHKVFMCQICAVASLGSLYSNGAVPMADAQRFYNIAKQYLDDVIQEDIFLAMKVCALLAMVNIVTKSTLALAFLETGLAMAHNAGLENDAPASGLDQLQWNDYKRVWRTLVLCTGWISSTLGTVASANWRSSHAALQRMDLHNGSMADLLQSEMAKIATMKANILVIMTTSKTINPDTISGVREDLRRWHTQLPPTMQLANMVAMQIEQHHKHKIYFVHLLYLGAIMLLQRCVMSHWISNDTTPSMRLDASHEILDCIRDGYGAARTSARILVLLKVEGGAVARCWICTFQSYISGLIIVQEVYRNLLSGTETQEHFDEALLLVQHTVDVLAFCAMDDTVADGLLGSLKAYHDSLKSIQNIGLDAHMQDDSLGDSSSPHSKLSDPITPATSGDGGSALHRTAEEILVLICRPFGGTIALTPGEDLDLDHGNFEWRKQKTMDETAFGVSLDWRWDMVRQGNTTVQREASIVREHSLDKEEAHTPARPTDRPFGWSADTWAHINIAE